MGTPKGTKPWNAGKSRGWIDQRGYRIISRTVNGKRQQVREHRVIIERHLKRALEPWELVHHKDGNPLNNSLGNLAVTTFGEHTKAHHKGQRHNYEARKTMEAFANLREELKRERGLNADLLAALEAALENEQAHGQDWQPWAQTARAAIAKARGA